MWVDTAELLLGCWYLLITARCCGGCVKVGLNVDIMLIWLCTSFYRYFTAVFTVSVVKQLAESSYTFNFKVPTVT